MKIEAPDFEAVLKALREESDGESTAAEAPEEIARCRGWVVFIISHENVNPDQITRDLGLEPDRIFYSNPLENQTGQWQLNSALNADETIEAHLWNILTRLAPIHRKLWKISEIFNLEFHCTIQKTAGAMEPFVLPARLLLLIGYIGASIEIEVMES